MANSTGRELGRQLAGMRDWSAVRGELVRMRGVLPSGSAGVAGTLGDALDELISRTGGQAQATQKASAGQQREASLQSAIPQSSASSALQETAQVGANGANGMGDDDELIAGIPRWKFGKGATLLGGW